MTEVNQELENKLWRITRPNSINQDDLRSIIDYLFERLSSCLKEPLEVIGKDSLDEDSFCRSFRGSLSSEIFKITYVGLLELTLVGDNFKPQINAWIFLFGDHFRLTAGQSDRSYLELVYDKFSENKGNWRSLGWMNDEFGQHEDIKEDEFL